MSSHIIPTYPFSRNEQNAFAQACNEAIKSGNSDYLVMAEIIKDNISANESLNQLKDIFQEFCIKGKSPLIIASNLPNLNENNFIVIIGISAILGEITVYKGEGNYIVEVKETIVASERPSFANAKDFFPHSDLTYVPEPPQILLLHCIANTPSCGGISQFCSVDDLINELDEVSISELQKPQFKFPAPDHYNGVQSSLSPILTKKPSGIWHIRFRRDSIGSTSKSGMSAISFLTKAIERSIIEVPLLPRQIAVFYNARALHGRTGFVVPDEGLERHINRAYVKL